MPLSSWLPDDDAPAPVRGWLVGVALTLALLGMLYAGVLCVGLLVAQGVVR
jgi:hypothetical protein